MGGAQGLGVRGWGLGTRKMHSTKTHARRGISLLEVLISMFILLVGLAGIASLLPAGRSEIIQGVKLDYATMIGRNAVRDLRAREMLNPENWTSINNMYNGPAVMYDESLTPAPFRFPGTFVQQHVLPVIIDPLGLANGLSGTTYAASYTSAFPKGTTLGATNLGLVRVSPVGINTTNGATLALARNLFTCGDDLDLQTNTTRGAPPLQRLNTTTQKRDNIGNYSWIATVIPDATSYIQSNAPRWTLSVAVIYKRDLSSAGAGESTYRVISLPGAGISGGEVVVWNPTKPLRAGQYVMMAGSDNSGGTMLKQFLWYKVVSASEITTVSQLPYLASNKPSNVGPTERVQPVTLVGADWAQRFFPTMANTATTVATPTSWPSLYVIDNVIAVYERPLDLDHH